VGDLARRGRGEGTADGVSAEDRARHQERAERAEWHLRRQYEHELLPWEHCGAAEVLAEAMEHQDRAADWARELREIAERSGEAADPAHVERATNYLRGAHALIAGLERRAEEQGGLQRRELRAAREALVRLRELSPQAPVVRTRRIPRPISERAKQLHAMTPAQARAQLRRAADAVTGVRGPGGLLRTAADVAPLAIAGHVDASEIEQVLMAAAERLRLHLDTDEDVLLTAIREGLRVGGKLYVDREM